MALVKLQEVKDYLKISHTAEDSMLQLFMESAQKELEQKHRRELGYQPERVEYHNGPGDRLLFLKSFPVWSLAKVEAVGASDGKDQVLSPSQYQLDQEKGMLVGNWLKGVRNYKVTYESGYWDGEGTAPKMKDGVTDVPKCPADLQQECLEIIAYMYENRRGSR